MMHQLKGNDGDQFLWAGEHLHPPGTDWLRKTWWEGNLLFLAEGKYIFRKVFSQTLYSSNLAQSTYTFVAQSLFNGYFTSCATLCCTRDHNIQPNLPIVQQFVISAIVQLK